MAALTSSSSKTPNIYEPISVPMKTAYEIPKACIKLAKILENQPLFDGKGSIAKKCKVIALSDWNDARICDIFNRNSSKILGVLNSWRIDSSDQLVDPQGNWIKKGLRLWLNDEVQMCSYENLEKSYDQVFSQMVTGWKKADLKDHPDIMFKENPKEFDLFIKERSLIEQDTLIRFITAKFSLDVNVKCNSEWLTYPGYRHDKSYLWIRKTELDKAVEKIGFQFDSSSKV